MEKVWVIKINGNCVYNIVAGKFRYCKYPNQAAANRDIKRFVHPKKYTAEQVDRSALVKDEKIISRARRRWLNPDKLRTVSQPSQES